MRFPPPKTLLAIAIGIATTAAFCGPPGPRGDNAGCPDTHLARFTERFSLTPEQQAQVKTIIEEEHTAATRLHEDARKRIDSVLTEVQRAQQTAAMRKRMGQHVDRLAKRLDLSAEQATQVRTILEEQRAAPDLDGAQVRERIAAVLTPAQRQHFTSAGPRDGRPGKKDCAPGRNDQRGGPDDDLADGSDGEGPTRP